MKLIKLDRRHSLYKDGFTHAFRGLFSDDRCSVIERYLARVYGNHNLDKRSQWYSNFAKHKMLTTNGYQGTVYYIALRNEADATMCMLSV